METVSCKEVAANLDNFIRRVITFEGPVVITSNDGQSAVLLSLREFQSMEETLYLLSKPANAEHLKESITELEKGQGIEVDLSDL